MNVNLTEYISEELISLNHDTYSKCFDVRKEIIYWDILKEFLKSSKKIYQIGMKIANTEYDFELKKYCKMIKEKYNAIDIHTTYEKCDIKIDKNKLIKEIMTMHGFCLLCINLIKEYENGEYY